MDENGINKSYVWSWDDELGWNFTTFFSFFNDFQREDYQVKYFEFVAIAFLSLCSFVVNFLLIIFFLTKKTLRNDLHMYTISIMFSSVLLIPFAMLVAVSRLSDRGWIFGNIGCQTTLFMLVATAFVKIWLMTLISVDRYLRVVHAQRQYMSRKLSIILIVIAWILPSATLAAMVYPNSHARDIDLHGGITICTVAFKWHPTIRGALVYFSTIFAAEFFLPATIMAVCYALIMKKIRKTGRALATHMNSSQRRLHNGKNVPERNFRTNIRRRKTTIILISIMVLFLVMWLPLFVLLAAITLDQMWETFQVSSRWIVGQICILLLNTLIEPFLYSFTTGKVRKELKTSLRSIKRFNNSKSMGISSIEDTSTQNYNSTGS